MSKKYDFNVFKKLGIEFDLEDKTYKIDFVPSPIEDELWSEMGNLDAIFGDMRKVTPEWNEKIKYWIWESVNHDRNGNGDINKEEFFALLGAAERIALLVLIIQLLGDRMRKMNELVTKEPEKKTSKNNPSIQ